jgi:hypothetical protein
MIPIYVFTLNQYIQDPHKLVDDYFRSDFELEMWHDIKIHVKHNTVNSLEQP